VRFKLDENLPASLVAVFASAGHDAVSATAQNLQGAPDARIAEVCRSEGRTLVTLDVDFADIRTYPPSDSPGIIVLRLRRLDVPTIKATIGRLLQLIEDRPVAKSLWIVDDDRVRFRT